jgi:ABC-type antimicrobial peptide transport system ATPase subunit
LQRRREATKETPRRVSELLTWGAGVTLALAEQVTQITVTPLTREEVGEQQIKVQETQRVFGFLPNFYVSYIPDAVSLTSKQKMKLAWKPPLIP